MNSEGCTEQDILQIIDILGVRPPDGHAGAPPASGGIAERLASTRHEAPVEQQCGAPDQTRGSALLARAFAVRSRMASHAQSNVMPAPVPPKRPASSTSTTPACMALLLPMMLHRSER
jgi:hypothetical protein